MVTRHLLLVLGLATTAVAASACSAITGFGDYTFGDAGGGMDAGTDAMVVASCEGQPDGTICGEAGYICLSGACVASACGDGHIDARRGEQCDDGNTEGSDGCEPGSCTFTCETDADCDDGDECTGNESCDGAAHQCMAGTALAEGAMCTMSDGGTGACRPDTGGGVRCVLADCGNGLLDMGEECDDSRNGDANDGCTDDCAYSCHADEDCDDGDVCTGMETCDTASAHACAAGTALDCSDGNACTEDLCDPGTGCSNPVVDMDMDGHSPQALGACGDDCDDARADVYTGAEELCDGLDNNCNGAIDEVAPIWYIDCDRDNFAADTGGSRTSCMAPPASATGCAGTGAWTTRRPADPTTTDCNDGNANMFPGQSMYFTSYHGCSGCTGDDRWKNYNCDDLVSYQYSRSYGADSAGTCTPRVTGFYGRYSLGCSGSTGWTLATQPMCGTTGNYTQCNLSTCARGALCIGYTAVCVAAATDPRCICSRPPCCTPGSVGCPWVLARCSRSTTTGQRMGCR